MKTPSFWVERNFISNLLAPLGMIYGFATKMRIKKSSSLQVSKPVICVGNLTAGGTGKTPVAISLSKILKSNFYNPFFISRGYGGKLKDIIVDNQKHSAKEVGDEPLLLSRNAPVVINSDRYKAAKKAINNGADVIVMDDGFQNPKLFKDLSFLVFDGGFGLGNRRCIPAGPLRERWYRGLRRSDAAIIIGEDKTGLERKLDRPIFHGKIVPVKPQTKNKNVICFAGIGRPEKFYDSMKELGFNVLETIDFPDHHQYKPRELKKIIEKAQKTGADVFTTSKDYVKIPTPLQSNFNVLEIEIQWLEEKMLTDFILSKIDYKPL